MRIILIISGFIIILLSCNHPANSIKKDEKPASADSGFSQNTSFFPVTSYIKGQLFEIREKGINPLEYKTVSNHTDSGWLKTEDLETAVHEFLYPVIDTANMKSLFTETKFLDQTIGAFSFSYDPIKILPDSMTLRHWDVYVDPETNKVKRIFIVKEIAGNKTLQLTWIGGKWCKIITIANHPGGITTIEKEEKITWDF